jgi:hypothetical protein
LVTLALAVAVVLVVLAELAIVRAQTDIVMLMVELVAQEQPFLLHG